jgi:hypothetical protein
MGLLRIRVSPLVSQVAIVSVQRLCPDSVEDEPIVDGKQSFHLLEAATAPLTYFEALIRDGNSLILLHAVKAIVTD